MNWKKLNCLFQGHKYKTIGYKDNNDRTAYFHLKCSKCGNEVYLQVPIQVLYTYQAMKIHEKNKTTEDRP